MSKNILLLLVVMLFVCLIMCMLQQLVNKNKKTIETLETFIQNP